MANYKRQILHLLSLRMKKITALKNQNPREARPPLPPIPYPRSGVRTSVLCPLISMECLMNEVPANALANLFLFRWWMIARQDMESPVNQDFSVQKRKKCFIRKHWTNRWMDRGTKGWMDGWTNGWIDRWTCDKEGMLSRKSAARSRRSLFQDVNRCDVGDNSIF